MNSLFIVLPILTILMFDLGLTLEGKDFRLVMLRYKAVLAGMIGQLFLLPLIAWAFFLSVCERRHEALAEEPETIPDSSAHPTSNA